MPALQEEPITQTRSSIHAVLSLKHAQRSRETPQMTIAITVPLLNSDREPYLKTFLFSRWSHTTELALFIFKLDKSPDTIFNKIINHISYGM
jgi:hypothetical protein